MAMSATGEVQKAYIDVYHEGQVQRVKFYRGTSADDLLGLILKMFHKLPENPTLSAISTIKLQCVFYDEDDDPVCFSPDVIPSGTKLFLRIQSPSRVTTATTQCSQKWTWDPVINAYPEIDYKLSADNTTVMQKIGGSKHSMPILCGTISFKSGQHQWRLSFTNATPYCGFGLISQSERDQLRSIDFAIDFTQYPLFQRFFNALSGHNDAEYTFILDMDHRKCTVKAGSRLTTLIMDLPSEVWPAVTIKNNSSQCIGKVYFD